MYRYCRGGGVELELAFRVADIALAGKAKSEIFDLITVHGKGGWTHSCGAHEALGPALPGPTAMPSAFMPPHGSSGAIPLFAR